MFKFLVAAILSLGSLAASAFDPRGETITVLIGFAPGGGTDIVVKPYLEKIEQMGYNTKIEYKPGLDSIIAMNHFSTLPRDGKTIMVTAASGLSLAPVLQEQLTKYNGFDLVSVIGFSPMVLITSADSKVNSFEDFAADIKQHKRTFAAGSLTGSSSALYIGSKLSVTKDLMVIANYKGMAPAVLDVAGGHVNYAVVPLTVARSLLESGKIKLLAIGGSGRNSKYPTVPTFIEKINGFAVETSESNWGIILPKNSPKEVVDFYANLFVTVGKDKALQEKLSNSIITIRDADLGPTKYNQTHQRSMNAWREIKN